MSPYRVSLVKLRPLRCTGRHCRIPLEPYTHQELHRGYTRFRPARGQRHTSICETRMWGRAVQAGAAFAPCEHTDDRHNAPLGGAA